MAWLSLPTMSAEIAGLEGTVDGVTDLGEEDRIRHRRIVPLPRKVVTFHTEWLEFPRRGIIARSSSRYRPGVAVFAVDRDGHLLRGFVDDDHDIGARGLCERERDERRGEGENKTVETHVNTPAPTLDRHVA